jgi:hypothetical protein
MTDGLRVHSYDWLHGIALLAGGHSRHNSLQAAAGREHWSRLILACIHRLPAIRAIAPAAADKDRRGVEPLFDIVPRSNPAGSESSLELHGYAHCHKEIKSREF